MTFFVQESCSKVGNDNIWVVFFFSSMLMLSGFKCNGIYIYREREKCICTYHIHRTKKSSAWLHNWRPMSSSEKTT